MKTLIIAEKPSVAADLAKALGKFQKTNSTVYENDKLIITCALGHIVELFMPDDIDKKLKWWSLKTLPIIPEKFQLKPIEKNKEKFEELKKLLHRKDVDCVINACDAGREGELIFTYIYELADCKKHVKRMWMSSMTPQSLIEAFQHPRSQEAMRPLQAAAKCRSESDWLIGINGTRAITGRMFGNRARQLATVGRVQTPTLTMVYEREQAILNFVPQSFWKLSAEFSIKNGTYIGFYQKPDNKKIDSEHDRSDRLWNQKEAQALFNSLQGVSPGIVSETKKQSKQSPPLLYDLTSLQREANSRFGMPAGMTLKIAQSLYEKHKLITYPRTDSKAIPEDYVNTCIEVLKSIPSLDLKRFAQMIIQNNWVNASNKRIFNNKKVSDHFAIIPTAEKLKKLSPEEQKIYDLIIRRFLAAFFPSAEFDVTTRITTLNNEPFKTEGKVLKEPGYLAIYGKEEEQENQLPGLSPEDGDPPKAKVLNLNLNEEQTKPPARYTEATLLSAMEHAGKLVEDEELAEAMKERGLGTPATRAQIIDHIINEKYVLRENRELIPTTKAENLIQFLQALHVDALTSPAMTGEWEFNLKQIEEGTLSREQFMNGIKEMTTRIVDQAKTFDENTLEKQITNIISPTDNLPMEETFRSYRSQDGKLIIYKTMGNRKLTNDEVKELAEKGTVGPLDNFRSKAGKPFSAILQLDREANKAKFVFGDRDQPDAAEQDLSQYQSIGECPLAKQSLCSHTQGKIYAAPNAYICEHHKKDPGCIFRVSRTLLERPIPEDQFKKLITDGKTDLLDKFRSKRTKRFFSAYLVLKEKGAIGFEFEPKAPKKTAKAPKAPKKKKEE